MTDTEILDKVLRESDTLQKENLRLLVENYRIKWRKDFGEDREAAMYQALYHWAHASLTEEQKNQFFCIVANGIPDVVTRDFPCFRSMITRKEHEIERLTQELADAVKQLNESRKDTEASAGELMVDINEMPPGSTLARVVTANSIIRRQRDQARASLTLLEEEANGLRRRIQELMERSSHEPTDK